MRFIDRIKRVFVRPNKYNHAAFLFSYPKCGRTWLNLQMGRAISQHFKVNYPNIMRLGEMAKLNPQIPSIRLTHEDQPHRKRPDELTKVKSRFAGKKVIFMVRDPRDVFVSYYFHKSKREKPRSFWWFQKKRRETHTPFSGSLSDFLKEDIGGFDTIIRYYNIWAENKNLPKEFMIVRYEDMKKDPNTVLRKVLDFVGLECITDAEVADAVEYAKFENMKKIESGNAVGSYKLKPGDKNDNDSYKVRKGKVGGYIEYFTPEEIELLNKKMADNLTPLYGYSPNTGEK